MNIFEDYNNIWMKYLEKKHREWENLENKQIEKILNKVNSFLSKENQLKYSDIEDVIKECIDEIHSYICKEIINDLD